MSHSLVASLCAVHYLLHYPVFLTWEPTFIFSLTLHIQSQLMSTHWSLMRYVNNDAATTVTG